jgi:hypothetical protein
MSVIRIPLPEEVVFHNVKGESRQQFSDGRAQPDSQREAPENVFINISLNSSKLILLMHLD